LSGISVVYMFGIPPQHFRACTYIPAAMCT